MSNEKTVKHDCRHTCCRCLVEDDTGRETCCYVGKMLCPVCGEHVGTRGNATDGRLILSCGDAVMPYGYYINEIAINKKHYKVVVREIHTVTLDVQAFSLEDALDSAEHLIENEDVISEYSYTLEKDDWTVFPA